MRVYCVSVRRLGWTSITGGTVRIKSGVICAGIAMMTFTGGKRKLRIPGLVPCVENLVSHHLECHDNVDPEVDVILDRYNLPNVGDVVSMAIERESP